MPKSLEVFFYFLKLGCLGFGGPMALTAQMQRETVDRGWITLPEFRRAFALIKAMPGTLAVQMAIFIGRHHGGWWCGLLAGLGLILPATFLMILIAIFYETFESSPLAVAALVGVQMAALALIFHALKPMTSVYWKRSRFWVLCGIGFLLFITLPIPEPALIFLFGLYSVYRDGHFETTKPNSGSLSSFLIFPGISTGLSLPSAPDILGSLFWSCFKAGAFVFGTGFAIVPVLQRDFVDRLGWISVDQFKDALAFGQMTPGPVVVTVTFIGYKVAGLAGAFAATGGVFLPSFFHQLTWFPSMMQKLSRQAWLPSFVLGAVAAVAAGILWVVADMLRGITAFQAVVFFLSLVVVEKTKVPAWFLLGCAGLASAVPRLF